jgi:hypothetical protein
MDDEFIKQLMQMESVEDVEKEYKKILRKLSGILDKTIEEIDAEIGRNLGKDISDILDGESE